MGSIPKHTDSSLRFGLKLFALYWTRNLDFAHNDYHHVFRGALKCLQTYTTKELHDARVLEIGCGQRFGTTLLFHSIGVRIVGVDYEVVPTPLSWSGVKALAKTSGVGRAAKSALRSLLFDRQYYTTLERELGRPLQFRGVDVRRMDARALAFDNASFDYVFSNAVFEHIDDVEAATREVARVLVPGGIARIGVHLFPSLSGGHHPDWAYPDDRASTHVAPWDHLRDRRHLAPVYLNELRENSFLSIFRQHFTILEVSAAYEGKEILSHSIINELSDYSEEELIKRSISVVMRRA